MIDVGVQWLLRVFFFMLGSSVCLLDGSGCSTCSACLQTPLNGAGRQARAAPVAAPPAVQVPEANPVFHSQANGLRGCLKASLGKSSSTAYGKQALPVMLQTWHNPLSHLVHLG